MLLLNGHSEKNVLRPLLNFNIKRLFNNVSLADFKKEDVPNLSDVILEITGPIWEFFDLIFFFRKHNLVESF